ncbi:MAG: hypothetical protein WBA39_03925 [Rivularia sp. (in: cyanobacteria)]
MSLAISHQLLVVSHSILDLRIWILDFPAHLNMPWARYLQQQVLAGFMGTEILEYFDN